MLSTDTIKALANLARNKTPSPPLPSDPDDAAAVALALILDPSAQVVPGEIFTELAKRNSALVNAPREEIQATLARQIVLLEAMATRLFQKAAITTSPSASAEFNRAALATNRVLIQALGAVHSMNQNQAPVHAQLLTVEGEDGADVA